MKSVFQLSTMLLCVILWLWGTQSAQAQSDKGVTIQAQDSIDASLNLSDTTHQFCGCQSIETVKACSDCFKLSGPVLRTGYEMSFESKTIVRGSCWDFANEVYRRSGLTKETVFSSNKGKRYADHELVEAGDWIYHINYAYGNVEHSAIFVCWKDKAKRQAVTLSYVGRNRAEPGRLEIVDLRSITSIFRGITD